MTDIGLGAAGVGLRALALESSRRLVSLPERGGDPESLALGGPGAIDLTRARISALLGDTLATMDFFRSAFEAGSWQARYYVNRHRLEIERLLHAYPPYVELTRPR